MNSSKKRDVGFSSYSYVVKKKLDGFLIETLASNESEAMSFKRCQHILHWQGATARSTLALVIRRISCVTARLLTGKRGNSRIGTLTLLLFAGDVFVAHAARHAVFPR